MTTDSMEVTLSNEYFALLISKLNDIRKTDRYAKNFHDSVIKYIRSFPYQVDYIPEGKFDEI